MTEVLYQGEYLDKDWLNMWLNTPEGKCIHEEEKAKEKAQAEEERKKQQQLQKQKLAENKSREKKVEEYFHKYRQEYAGSISDELAHMLWQRAHNAVEAERRDEEYRKQREEERRQMEESRKKRQEEREQMLETITKARRRKKLQETILKEYDKGLIVRLDNPTHDRLVDFGKPGF